MNKFENFNIDSQLLTAIDRLGFTEPTQIQKESIPPIMEGRDIIGESATGSGKTLAFGCGIIETAIPKAGLQALILTPTRELAEQVRGMLQDLSYNKPLRITAIYGGVAINPQIHDLSRADVVVATPGRLLDHLQRKTINISKIKILVLDEADRMLDMGFIEDVERIIRACPNKRQTMFFSATILPRIRGLANRYMRQPANVSARKLVDPNKLKQAYYNIPKNLKLSLLAHLLENEKSGLVMVFCNTRKTTDFVVKNLRANRINAIAIHGGFAQNKRAKTIKLFHESKAAVLVCTDVAARGLHIDNVSHIYNYEIPRDPNDYVHRIGRTARAGEEGKVINLLCDYDYDNFSRIIETYRSFSIENIKRPYLKMIQTVRVDEQPRGHFKREYRKGGSIGRFSRRSDQHRGHSKSRFGRAPTSRFSYADA